MDDEQMRLKAAIFGRLLDRTNLRPTEGIVPSPALSDGIDLLWDLVDRWPDRTEDHLFGLFNKTNRLRRLPKKERGDASLDASVPTDDDGGAGDPLHELLGLRDLHPDSLRPGGDLPLTPDQEALSARLGAVDPDLATSYRQVLADVASPRGSYVGPAGEIREVLRGAITQLAPDGEVTGQSWFVGDHGRPTHAERIRLALQKNHAPGDAQTLQADSILDEKIGRLGRSLYERSSRALHARTQQREVGRIVDWVEVVLDEVLPGV